MERRIKKPLSLAEAAASVADVGMTTVSKDRIITTSVSIDSGIERLVQAAYLAFASRANFASAEV